MLVRHADTITAAIVAAESDLAAARDEIGGDLRVAAFPTAARAILPSVIADLVRAHPHLRVTLRDLETAEAMAAIRLDEVDLALVDQYDDVTQIREPGVELVELPGDQLYVALPPARPHAGGAVRLDELALDPWIMDTEASNIYGAVVRGCRALGFEPNVRSHCRDYSVIIALVEAGLGVAILPGLALRDREIRARVLPLDPPQDRQVSIALKPERRAHPAVAAMVGALLRSA